MAGSVDVAPILAEGQPGDGFVMSLDDTQRLGGVVDVQVVDEARQGHGQHMRALPQARYLEMGTLIDKHEQKNHYIILNNRFCMV